MNSAALPAVSLPERLRCCSPDARFDTARPPPTRVPVSICVLGMESNGLRACEVSSIKVILPYISVLISLSKRCQCQKVHKLSRRCEMNPTLQPGTPRAAPHGPVSVQTDDLTQTGAINRRLCIANSRSHSCEPSRPFRVCSKSLA